MLSNDHIFVKLTKKYCNDETINDEVVLTFDEGNDQYLVIFWLIKNGCVNYILGCEYCHFCEKSHLDDANVSKWMKIEREIKYNGLTLIKSMFVWNDCVIKVNNIFNEIIIKLGRDQFKKLYYKLFIFLHRENMIFDVYCKIGQKLFEIYCE